MGVYVNAFNVYYGGRDICGRGSAGWRWLDVGSLAMGLIQPHWWPDARLARLVYCTAPRTREGDPSSAADQQTYVAALLYHRPETVVVNGRYAPRIKTGVLIDRACARRVPSPGADGLPAWLPATEIVGAGGGDELLVSTALKGKPDCGAGRHWWRRLRAEGFRSNQLPDVVGRYRRPEGW